MFSRLLLTFGFAYGLYKGKDICRQILFKNMFEFFILYLDCCDLCCFLKGFLQLQIIVNIFHYFFSYFIVSHF